MTPAPRPVAYGDLMRAARRHVADGAVALVTERIPDQEAARAAITAYRNLLASLHDHALVLDGGPRRIDGVRMSGDPSRVDVATVELIDAFAAARIRRRPSSGAETATVGLSWRRADQCVGAAADLLATHRTPSGGWRSPDAEDLDAPAVRSSGILDLANLTDCVLAAHRDLTLRSGQAGLRWTEVARLLPELDGLRTANRRVLTVGDSDPAGRRLLDDLGIARPTIRTGEPLTELGDRILRLRRTAWQLQRNPRVGVASLTDLATAAVIFHTYAAQAAVPPGWQTGIAEQARDAWSVAHLHLRELRTATPGLAIARSDLLGIRDTCRRLLAAPDTRGAGAGPVGGLRDQATVVAGGLRAFRNIAGIAADRLDQLSYTGQLYVSGRRLTGDQVTDDPNLVTAKLEGALVVAPREQAEPALDALHAARGRPSRNEPARAHEKCRQAVISR